MNQKSLLSQIILKLQILLQYFKYSTKENSTAFITINIKHNQVPTNTSTNILENSCVVTRSSVNKDTAPFSK